MRRRFHNKALHRSAAILSDPAVDEPPVPDPEMEVSAQRERSAATIVEDQGQSVVSRGPRSRILLALYDIDRLGIRIANFTNPGICRVDRRMMIDAEIQELRRRLDEMALEPDDDLGERYTMHRPGRPPGLYWQLRWLAGRILRRMKDTGILASDPWPASLKHGKSRKNARPLVVWAMGADPDSLRSSCATIADFLVSAPEFAPVLITDVPDFSYYSRLGWLIEYLPAVHGSGEAFESRKARFLARLYRGAVILPLRADLDVDNIRDHILSQTRGPSLTRTEPGMPEVASGRR